MKKIVSGLLAVLLMAGGLHLPARAADTAAPASGKGDISVVLQLNYPEKAENLAKRGFQIKLTDSAGKTLASTPLNSTNEWEFNGSGFRAEAAALGQDGQPLSGAPGDAKIHYYRVDFLRLQNNSEYQVALEGSGYKNFTSDKIKIDQFSRQLQISTKDASFTIGDVDSNGRVDGGDLAQVEKALGSSSTLPDLNCDGTVDISDVALVNHHIRAAGGAELLETSAIGSLVAYIDEDAMGDLVAEGKVNDIFDPDAGSVTFKAPSGQDLVLPITMRDSIVLSQVEILCPQANGAILEGTAEVVYEDENGRDAVAEYALSAGAPLDALPLTRDGGASPIVISLGKRVPVKRITVTVTKVQGEDGKPTFAVIDEIRFLRDIVPENPAIDGSIPRNLSAAVGDGQVRLTWKAVNNVTGYRVKYGTASGRYESFLDTEVPSLEVQGLKNLTEYFFVVHSLRGDVESGPSAEVKAIPLPSKAPLPPDFVKAEPLDRGLRITWKATENATAYNLYYKKKSDSAFVKYNEEPYTAAQATIGGLENGVE